MKFIYVIGEPGIGKTTAVAAVLGPGSPFKDDGVPYTVHTREDGVRWVQLGAPRDNGFGGTDAMAMDIQPKVLAWLAKHRPSHVLAEGDRLANGKFFLAVQELGYSLTVAYLAAPPTVASGRRKGRGTDQNMTWVQGRVTKIRNLIQDVRWDVVRVEADAPGLLVAAALAKVLYHPGP